MHREIRKKPTVSAWPRRSLVTGNGSAGCSPPRSRKPRIRSHRDGGDIDVAGLPQIELSQIFPGRSSGGLPLWSLRPSPGAESVSSSALAWVSGGRLGRRRGVIGAASPLSGASRRNRATWVVVCRAGAGTRLGRRGPPRAIAPRRQVEVEIATDASRHGAKPVGGAVLAAQKRPRTQAPAHSHVAKRAAGPSGSIGPPSSGVHSRCPLATPEIRPVLIAVVPRTGIRARGPPLASPSGISRRPARMLPAARFSRVQPGHEAVARLAPRVPMAAQGDAAESRGPSKERHEDRRQELLGSPAKGAEARHEANSAWWASRGSCGRSEMVDQGNPAREAGPKEIGPFDRRHCGSAFPGQRTENLCSGDAVGDGAPGFPRR